MPLFCLACDEGHLQEVYEHSRDDLGCRTVLCETCGHTMGPTLSVGLGLTYFSEKRPRIIHNLGHEPITITSHEQHKAEMKKAGVEWAPPKRGMPGCW